MTITVDDRGAIHLPEELLRRLGAGPGSQLVAEASERGVLLRTVEKKRIWQVVAEAAEQLPPEVCSRLPADGAEQHDHYIYGSPKRGPA